MRAANGDGAATSVVAMILPLAMTVAIALGTAPPAHAVFGDDFGVAPVNVSGAPTSPAFPGSEAFWAGACDVSNGPVAVGSGAPAPGTRSDCIDLGTSNPIRTSLDVWSVPPAWRLASDDGAGVRPDATVAAWLRRSANNTGNGPPFAEGAARSIVIDVPPGFLADPTALPRCSSEAARQFPPPCPPATQVGIATNVYGQFTGPVSENVPVYNVAPRRGKTAEFLIAAATGVTNVPIVADVRSDGDFGATTTVGPIPTFFTLLGVRATLWGVPWDPSHDLWRAPPGVPESSPVVIPLTGLPPAQRQSYSPTWGPVRPFLVSQTECAPLAEAPETVLNLDSWQAPHQYLSYSSPAPPVVGCEKAPFDPVASFAPTSGAPDSAAGLDVDIDIPQKEEPPPPIASDPVAAAAYWNSDAGVATAQLDKTVVELPEGMSVNPSSAAGLEGCSDAQVGVTQDGNPKLFNDEDPFDDKGTECPDGSVIGTVEASTPLLEETLTGEAVLGVPESTDPESGRMFRLFLVLRNRERGLLAKVFGSAVANPATGRLTATFDKNPRVPVENIEVSLKGGPRGLLATPPACGEKTVQSVLTPWTAAHGGGGVAKAVDDSFVVAGDCSNGFAPTLAAGMNTQNARGTGTFSFRFARRDGEQYLRGLTAKLPHGLLASVKGVPLCSNAAADDGACPAGSKIGLVDAKAGAGDPFVLEQKGEVFLTQGYKGGEYGLAVKIRPVAGPFRGAVELSPIMVRQAIHVDRATAQVTAISDPFPLIHHGVPLRVREVTVLVDRDRFMLNPSDCDPQRIAADLTSDQGGGASPSSHFQATGCAALPFKPKIGLALTGRRQVKTGKHPGVKAVVTQQGTSEAGIEKAVVRLPKSLALDPNNAQALCEFADGTKPDLENRCPKGSIVGRARAKTPLLNEDLVGNVYFVKNIRRDPKTGNEIRTLPMIIVALRGEISINLKGESSTTEGGKLVNTFANVPDAPISQFNLNINGGSTGIIAVTRTRKAKINICIGRHVAEADMDGHNGRRRDSDVRMKNPCTKKQTKAAKRRAKRAAAKAKR